MPIDSISNASAAFCMTTWQKLYEKAVLEADNSKLCERIAAARHAILDRAEEIHTGSSGDEHRALNAAMRTPKILEKEVAD
jgi:hypothetical protein